MKTNYAGHESVYRKHKATGKDGWDADPVSTKETLDTMEKALKSGYLPKKGRMIELGCGAGNVALWLADKGYEISGVEISSTAVEWAKEKAKAKNIKADFRVGNVVDLKDYKDNTFDFVLDGHCLHCIIGDDRKQFLKNALRIIKPKGVFFVDTMCGEILNEDLKKQFDPKTRCLILPDGTAQRYIGLAEDIVREVKDAGFKVLHHEISLRKSKDDNDTVLVYAVKE
ncbi:MAG: class I SAM-dependent methyltransferase [Planctomycetes bacterium]|nr:class I SAM-dependent methyltransferase [Planctomycetota bacterium]